MVPLRRSARLAAKPAVSYMQTPEVPDELLLSRTRAMFDTLLEERMSVATRDFDGVYWKCRDDFFKMFKDLPEDDVERIAAHEICHTLPAFSDQNLHARSLIAKRMRVLRAAADAAALAERAARFQAAIAPLTARAY